MSIFTFLVIVLVLLYLAFCMPLATRKKVILSVQNWVIKLAENIVYKRIKRCEKHSKPFCDPDSVKQYLKLKIAERSNEVFCCFFLDNKHNLIEFKEMFYGTVNYAAVHPREVVRMCLDLNAAAIILAHNHPSGDTKPSNSDEDITCKLKDILSVIDVRLLDHLIVGKDQVLSFAEKGMI